MSPDSVRVPLPAKELAVFDGVPCEVDTVAAGFWTNSIHVPVHPVPQFVPGAHNEMVPLVIAIVAYEFVPKVPVPSPFVK